MKDRHNIDRFKEDIKSLIDQGSILEISLTKNAFGADYVKDHFKIDESKIKSLPNFNKLYETWYSECLALIRQILPDRLQDFKDHFESPKNRKDITNATYRIQDAIKGLQITRGGQILADSKAAVTHFQQQCAILLAAERRFESSIFEIRQLVQADLFDSELDAARELLKNKFIRASGAIAGVVLEKHLKQVCDSHNIKIAKKYPSLGDLNDLLKNDSVIDVPQWRFISMLADIRNICDHNKEKEPTTEQVEDIIDGTEKIIKTIF